MENEMFLDQVIAQVRVLYPDAQVRRHEEREAAMLSFCNTGAWFEVGETTVSFGFDGYSMVPGTCFVPRVIAESATRTVKRYQQEVERREKQRQTEEKEQNEIREGRRCPHCRHVLATSG